MTNEVPLIAGTDTARTVSTESADKPTSDDLNERAAHFAKEADKAIKAATFASEVAHDPTPWTVLVLRPTIGPIRSLLRKLERELNEDFGEQGYLIRISLDEPAEEGPA